MVNFTFTSLQEMKELAALAYRDTTAENREFWKNEMGQALREIQQVYDEKLESMRSEMETFYNLKVMITGLFRCSPQTPLATAVFNEFVGPPQDILTVAQHVLLRRKFFNISKKSFSTRLRPSASSMPHSATAYKA